MMNKASMLVLMASVLGSGSAQAAVIQEAVCRIDHSYLVEEERMSLRGEFKVIRDEKGLIGSYKVAITMSDDEEEVMEKPSSRDVTQGKYSRDEVKNNEALAFFAKIAEVDLAKVSSAVTFEVEKETDPTTALVVFKDSEGKVLGQGLAMGYVFGPCLK